jgi:hypothetical protein
MSSAILAAVIFIVFIVGFGGLALFLIYPGKLSFWKLALKLPEEAISFMESDPAWVFAHESKKPPGYVGPFFLPVPSIGQTIKLYADPDRMEESEERFLEQYRNAIPSKGFPYPSFFALAYPVAAMLSMAEFTAPVVIVLGYGFANLGYLLLAAGLVAGQFRAFSLEGRIPTIIAAVVVWVAGVVLSNAA